MIANKVMPRIRATVARSLGATGTLVEVRNTLEGDNSRNLIAGSVDFLALSLGNVLNSSKGYADRQLPGTEYLDVADGEDYSVDEHTFSPFWERTVTLLVEEVGNYGPSDQGYVSAQLQGLIDLEIEAQVAEGFALRGRATTASEGVQKLRAVGWTRIISGAQLAFRRVEIRNQQAESATLGAIEAAEGAIAEAEATANEIAS